MKEPKSRQPKQKRRQLQKQWRPPPYTVEVHRAVQAIERYSEGAIDDPNNPPPSPHMMKLYRKWLMFDVCQINNDCFRPNGRDEVMYMLGRRSVALAIAKLETVKVEIFEDD